MIIIFYNFRYNQLLLSSFFRNLGTTIPIRVHCFTFSHDNSFLHCNTSPIICNNMSFLTLERLLAINRIDQTSSWLLFYSSNSVMTLMFIPCPAFCTTRAIFFKSVHIKTLKCTPSGYAANLIIIIFHIMKIKQRAKESNSADFCICHICKNLHMFPPSIMCGPNMVNLGCMVMEKLT